MKKKTLSLLLALALVLSLLPITALAGNVPSGTGLPDFSVFAGETELPIVLTESEAYTSPYGGDPVTLYTVEVPVGTKEVDLEFSGNILAYNYDENGFLAGDYTDVIHEGVSAVTVSVDFDNDGSFDDIQVQTPYDDNWANELLYAITFRYPLPFSAAAGWTALDKVTVKEGGYTPQDVSDKTPVTLYTVAIPEGTETVDLTFSEEVLAYNYSASGFISDGGRYPGNEYYVGSDTASVSVDAHPYTSDTGDGVIDFIQVQTPYDAYFNSTVLFAITFDDGSSSGGSEGGETKPVTEAALLDGIASVYAADGPGTDGNAAWAAADMVAYASLSNAQYELTEAQMETVKNNAVNTLSGSPAVNEAVKNIIALVALGYDPTQLTTAEGEKFNAKDVIDALAFTASGDAAYSEWYEYDLPYVIMAYRLLGDTQSVQKLIALALEIKDKWMATTWGVDGMTPFMVALAPEYGSDSGVKAALDDAINAVKTAQLPNGSVDGNPSSTGLAIAGFTALGLDPHEIKNGEKSLIDGLLTFAQNDGTSLGSAVYTEQGFRGLVAAAKGKGYTTYAFDTADLKPAADLSIPSVTFNIQPDNVGAKLVFKDSAGKEIAPAAAGVFSCLERGDYTYEITASGFETVKGSVKVTAYSRETIYVSLVRTAPDGSEPESNTAVVTIRVLSHDSTACGGKYTYRQNAYAYSSILGEESYSVTVVKGQDTARDVLVAALTKFHIPFTEEANGYFSMINNESEMDHGSANSGWMYLVNGVSPTVSAGEYVFAGNATMIWYFTDDYTNEFGSEEWNTDPQPSGSTSAGKTGAADVDNGLITVKPEVVDGEAKAEIKGEDAAKAIESGKTAKVVTVKVDTTDAEKVETVLSAEAITAIEKADMGLRIVTENGDVKVDAKTMAKLAETGKNVAVTVTRNSDGTTTISLTAGGENIDAKIKVELPAVSEKQILAIMNAEIKAASATLFADSADEGEETPVILSVVKDGTIYAVIPAGATVKVVDAEPMSFGDVKTTDWFAEAVDFVSSRGIFQGTDQGFEPGKNMDRAMLAMVLYRIAGAVGGGASAFADVDPEAWYADAVAWAADAGVVKGRGEGYAPAAPVTREEIATMLYRFASYLGVNVSGSADLSVFPDSGETSAWAKDAMAWAVSAGLFQGDDARALNPGGNATRAEVATLMERLVSLIVM